MTRSDERHLGGLWCHEVLEHLPAFVDGSLGDADRAAIETHLGGCDWCERFGGAYAATVATLRRGEAPELPEDVAARLEARLLAEP